MVAIGNLVAGVIVLGVLGAATVGGGFYLRRALRRFWRAIRIRRLGPVNPGRVGPGDWAVVEGTVPEDTDAVTAPLSGEPAVVAVTKLERKRDGPGWTTKHEHATGATFQVRDAGTSVAVDGGSGIALVAGEEHSLRVGSEDDVTEGVRRFVDAVPALDEPVIATTSGTGAARYREEEVPPGTDITVAGPAERRDGTTTFAGDDVTVGATTPGGLATRLVIGGLGSFVLAAILLMLPAGVLFGFVVPRLTGG